MSVSVPIPKLMVNYTDLLHTQIKLRDLYSNNSINHMLRMFNALIVTPAATVGGAALGGIAGPGGAALGAGTAYAGARIYELSDEKKELVDSITHGDVSAIVASGLAEHQTGF